MTNLIRRSLSYVPVKENGMLENVRPVIEADLLIESIATPADPAKEGVVSYTGLLRRPSELVFPGWLVALRRQGYTPMLRLAPEAGRNMVNVRIFAGAPQITPSRSWINLVMGLLTFVSTLFVGALYGNPDITSLEQALTPAGLAGGLPFALTLLGILAAHEFGHYFAARYHKVAVTLPYFIPMPLGFGTLGAVIRMKEPVPDRRKLFDIGVAGPLAGLVLAVPLLFYGLATSEVLVPPPMEGAMIEGNSLLYFAAKWLVHGQVLPNPVTGMDVMMNQICFAAWIGLLVTALNLLPVGQLDGGHTVFALFGKRAQLINRIATATIALFALLGLEPVQQMLSGMPALYAIAQAVGYAGWFLWVGMIVLVIGVEHPPALDDVTRLDRRRQLVGYAVLVIFLLIFVPVPLRPI